MEQTAVNADYGIEAMKRKMKRQRSLIALLSCAVFIFTMLYFF